MLYQKSDAIELKEIVGDDITKVIIAFANCQGGTIYIGVRKEGTIVGLDDTDSVILRIRNIIKYTIKPDLTMFIHYEILDVDGKKLVAVNVERGTGQPYFASKIGLLPEGVYIRHGCYSLPASKTVIRSMIKEIDGDCFEEMRSFEQKLSFNLTTKIFKHRNVEFGRAQMHTLKLINNDGIYTNLGMLLSDQCVQTIKVAVFQGKDQSIFKDRREFSGSLLQQLNEVYDYIDIHNQTQATFDKLLRIDTRDYPEVALREALLNLIVHRDYAFQASALISIYSDRIEFLSIGGLLPGIDLDDVMVGLSICRNQNLANVFYRLKLIEAYGTGIKKIMNSYENNNRKPVIQTTNNAFKITLPNVNVKTEDNIEVKDKNSSSLNKDECSVIDIVKENDFTTREEIENKLDVSTSTASRLLRRMVGKGILEQQGNGKRVKYILFK